MVLISVRCTHAAIVRPHPDRNYNGYMLACTCGWIAYAYHPPEHPMFYTEPHIAEQAWSNLHMKELYF